MKKMIVMLAAVAMAACAQAATVTWTVLDPNAKGVFLIESGSTAGEAAEYWSNAKMFLTDTLFFSSWEDQLSYFQDNMLKEFQSIDVGSFSYEGGDIVEENYAYLVLLVTRDNENLTPGDAFDVYIVDDTEKSHSFNLNSMESFASAKLGTEAIPEPTSGLLLLLGMAGLALKRKVA